jgi:hypothetical protein
VTAIYGKFEGEFRQTVNENQFVISFRALLNQFGKPLDVGFMNAGCGTKVYLTGISKPLWKFRYDVSTTKYKRGEYHLSVEVVFDKGKKSLTSVTFGKFVKNLPDSGKDQKSQPL